jgi:peptide/nickel transport system permease protein
MTTAVDVAAATPRSRRLRRIRGVPGMTAACFAVIGLIVVAAVLGEHITPHDPAAQDLSHVLSNPTATHWLGTDELGRDVFSRLIMGTRTALIGPLIAAFGAMLFGNIFGLWAGYRGGLIDSIIMRVADLAMAIPSLLVILVVAGTLGGGYWISVLLFMIVMIPGDARMARAATMEQAPRPYVEAARTLGVSNLRIMLSHIWPNVAAILIANAFLAFSGALVGLASLSYLVGGTPGLADWGQMIADGQVSIFQNPVATLAPGVAIVVLAAAMNLIGDWMYDKLSSRGTSRD